MDPFNTARLAIQIVQVRAQTEYVPDFGPASSDDAQVRAAPLSVVLEFLTRVRTRLSKRHRGGLTPPSGQVSRP